MTYNRENFFKYMRIEREKNFSHYQKLMCIVGHMSIVLIILVKSDVNLRIKRQNSKDNLNE